MPHTFITGPKKLMITIKGGNTLDKLVEFDPPQLVTAFDELKQVAGHPLPGQFALFGTALVVGNPCNSNVYSLAKGKRFTLQTLQDEADTFYRIDYSIVDESIKAVRFKFELTPSPDSMDFSLIEYAAAFQPVLSNEYSVNDVVTPTNATNDILAKRYNTGLEQ
jgi:hypothetical protein